MEAAFIAEKQVLEQQLQVRKSIIIEKEQVKVQEIGKKPIQVLLDEIDTEDSAIVNADSEGKDKGFLKPSDSVVKNNLSRGPSPRAPSQNRYNTQLQDDLNDSTSSMLQMDTSANVDPRLDEAALNSVLKTEMDKVNDSLRKITQCLNVKLLFNCYRA